MLKFVTWLVVALPLAGPVAAEEAAASNSKKLLPVEFMCPVTSANGAAELTRLLPDGGGSRTTVTYIDGRISAVRIYRLKGQADEVVWFKAIDFRTETDADLRQFGLEMANDVAFLVKNVCNADEATRVHFQQKLDLNVRQIEQSSGKPLHLR